MKLYNIYERLILESVNIGDIKKAIQGDYAKNGTFYIRRYNITYAGDDNSAKGERQIEIYALGKLNGNPVIRAYQLYGDTETGNRAWKLFRLDRIISMRETKSIRTAPITDYDAYPPSYVSQKRDDANWSPVYDGRDKSMDGGKADIWVEFPRWQIDRALATKDPVEPASTADIGPEAEPVKKMPVKPEVEPTVEPEVEPTVEPEITREPQPTVEPEVEPTVEPTRELPMEPEVGPEDEELEDDNEELR